MVDGVTWLPTFRMPTAWKDDRSMPLNRLLLAPLAVVLDRGRAGPARSPFRSENRSSSLKRRSGLCLLNNCKICHSASTNSKGGLRVDDRNGLIQGGGRGPAVVPGDPENSILIQAVLQTEDDLKMPPKKRLTAEEIAVLDEMDQGRRGLDRSRRRGRRRQPNPRYEKLRKEHWAWQPLKKTVPPLVHDLSWPRSEIDRFVLARLENAGLKPVATPTSVR